MKLSANHFRIHINQSKKVAKYFVYIRKSTDTEDKQVLSLESQTNELKEFIKRENLQVVEFLPGESKSAKQPGRPLFNQMITRIEKGEADGIISWLPDRLARNWIDGGKIVHMLDTGQLKDLKFPTYNFENSSQGKFMLSIMFGQSKYYVDNLSENVRRGNRTKLQKGWLPGLAPLGYLNEPDKRTIVRDPDRFPLVQRMWRLLLSENVSVDEILRTANEDWVLRSRNFKRRKGKKLCESYLYELFCNPFYCGIIKRAGETYKGSHEPMISVAEFKSAQRILGRKNKQRPSRHTFAYTGIIRCGECGGMITAEIQKKSDGSSYVYYHCTKRKKSTIKCSQKYIRVDQLEKQIKSSLSKISIPESVTEWALSYLRKINDREIHERQAIFTSQQRAYNDCQKQLDEVTQMRFKRMLSDEEYSAWKEKLMLDLNHLKEKIEDTEHRARNWFELTEKAFIFANKAQEWFARGGLQQRRIILKAIGSNYILKNGILHIQLQKPFSIIAEKSKSRVWWTLPDSNRSPLPCHGNALPDELRAHSR